jgi:hypothetical protein
MFVYSLFSAVRAAALGMAPRMRAPHVDAMATVPVDAMATVPVDAMATVPVDAMATVPARLSGGGVAAG